MGEFIVVKTKETVVPLILPCIAKYPVVRVVLFGSFARGTNSESSDLDLMFELDVNENYPSLSYIYELLDEIEGLIKIKVDYVTNEGLRSSPCGKLTETIKNEGVLIYEI